MPAENEIPPPREKISPIPTINLLDLIRAAAPTAEEPNTIPPASKNTSIDLALSENDQAPEPDDLLQIVKDTHPDLDRPENLIDAVEDLCGGNKERAAEMVRGINPKVWSEAIWLHKGDADLALRLSLVFQDEKDFNTFSRQMEKGDSNLRHLFGFAGAPTRDELKDLSKYLIESTKGTIDFNAIREAVFSWTFLTENQKQLPAKQLSLVLKKAKDLTVAGAIDRNSPEEQKILFSIIDRYPDLKAKNVKALVAAEIALPGLIEKIAKVPAPWHQAAALVATSLIADANEKGSIKALTPERFWLTVDEVKKHGKIKVLLECGDPNLGVRSLFPSISPDLQELLAQVCRDDTRAGESPVAKLLNFQPNVYRDAVEYLRDFHHLTMEELKSDNIHSWQVRSFAFSLTSNFGKDWKKWLAVNHADGITVHDACYWLPIEAPKQVEGLGAWLMKNHDANRADLNTVALRWSELKPEQRSLPLKDVLLLLATTKYANVKHTEFANENARWSVPETEYANREHRFLSSTETPSPFPTDKRWQSGKLEGYFLKRSNPAGLYLGHHTGCCQHPDNAAKTAAWHGQESPDGGFFVVVEKNNPDKIVAGSWVWVSDNGGVCFDSIESINLYQKGKDVLEIYKLAATALTDKAPIVTVSTEGKFENLGEKAASLPNAGKDALKLPSNYNDYSDTTSKNQVVLARSVSAPARNEPDNTSWVRGVDRSAAPKTGELLPLQSRRSLGLVLENRKDGTIGFAGLDYNAKELTSLHVAATHTKDSGILLRNIRDRIAESGGEWTCKARASTTYLLLKQAERDGLIKILESIKFDNSGESFYSVKFTAIPQAQAGGQPGHHSGVDANKDAALDHNTARKQPTPEKPASDTVNTKDASVTACSESLRGLLIKQLDADLALRHDLHGTAGSASPSDLTPEQFKELFELAIAKVKTDPTLEQADLLWIETVQGSNETNDQRIRSLQSNLLTARGNDQQFPPAEIKTDAKTVVKPVTAQRSAPSQPSLPDLVITSEAGSKITEAKAQKPTTEKNKLDQARAATERTRSQIARYGASGIGLGGGLLTLISGGLELQEHLNDK